MRMERVVGAAVLLLALLVLIGCGETASEVTGKVTVDGQPVAKGTIAFYPADGKGKTSGGDITDGTYTVSVPRGTMKVAITKPKVVRTKKLYPDDPKSKEVEVTEESLPPKYSDPEKTELRLDVTGGKVEKNWELTSK
jgi:hypothetical protein